MNNLNDTLPDLMRRATENLEPESSDLVERGMRRGQTLRRRRTALLSFSGATAVLATAGIVITGTQVLGGNAAAPASGTQGATVDTTKIIKSGPVTPKETLATLLGLLPPELKVSKSTSWGDAGFSGAGAVLNDGNGASWLTMSVSSSDATCFDPQPGSCVRRADGSRITTETEAPVYSKDNNPGGVILNSVQVTRADGGSISLHELQRASGEAGRAHPGEAGTDRGRADQDRGQHTVALPGQAAGAHRRSGQAEPEGPRRRPSGRTGQADPGDPQEGAAEEPADLPA